MVTPTDDIEQLLREHRVQVTAQRLGIMRAVIGSICQQDAGLPHPARTPPITHFPTRTPTQKGHDDD